MADEKKLGPGIVYTNPDKSTPLMTVAGVLLREGKSVNLVEKLGEARATPILQKLAKVRFFKVDGGPDHQKVEAQPQVNNDVDSTANNAVREAARIRESQGAEAAERYIDSLDDDGNVKGAKAERRPRSGEPPDDVKTPDEATLERPAGRRN
jgi:hypothetical protein